MKAFLVTSCYLLLVCGNTLRAQEFSIEDIEIGRHSYLKAETLKNLQWKGSANEIVYSKGDTLFLFSHERNKEQFLLNKDDLNQSLELSGEKAFKFLPKINFFGENEVYVRNKNEAYILDLLNSSYRKLILPAEVDSVSLNTSKGCLAYTFNNNVYVLGREGEVVQVSTDSLEGIDNGSTVYRNEFGIEKGLFWSPEGNYLAYYRKDETEVGQYPLVDISTPSASLISDRYPMVGNPMEKTEVWIYSLDNNSKIKLSPPAGSGVYMTNISWSMDEKTVYLQHLNRGQDTLVLRSYSAESGEFVSELFTEVHPKYVEPQHSLHFLEGSPGDFLYLSERSGFNHLYLYHTGLNKLEQLTSGDWDITQLVGIDPSEQYVYFMATEKSPLESHLYRLDRDTRQVTRITSEAGTHTVSFNSEMSLFLDKYSSRDIPKKIELCNAEGQTQNVLLDAPNPIENFTLGATEIGVIKAGDDKTDVYYKLTKPTYFDPEKKYPLILYVYSGPHVQLITDSWMNRIDYLQQYLAQQGYVSLMIDTRGSDNRGRDFEDIIYRQHGIPQMEDQVRAIEFISTFSWVDTNRIGVHGWSYGGFMTIDLMLNYPDIFKVGVAGGGLTDWSYYEVMYGERYMDTPLENPEGYEKTNLVLQADKLEGKLIIIHGALDDVVVWQNSLKFIQACIKLDKSVDTFIYPGHKHNVVGKDRVHLTRLITNYFKENL